MELMRGCASVSQLTFPTCSSCIPVRTYVRAGSAVMPSLCPVSGNATIPLSVMATPGGSRSARVLTLLISTLKRLNT